MDAIVVTQAELLEALRGAMAPDEPNARTCDELSAATGMSVGAVRRAIKQMGVAGRIGVHTVTRTRIDGQPCRVPAYTLAAAPARKRAR